MSLMKKISGNLSVLITIVFLTTLSGYYAVGDTNISKKYHITKASGQNVNITARLTEASGLTLSPSGRSLWTVSDNKKNLVFKMTLHGKPKSSESFAIVDYPFVRPDLEGICLSDDGQDMYLVQERELAIIKIRMAPSPNQTAIVPIAVQLSSMRNYAKVVLPFLDKNKNSGLEGIAFHNRTKDIFVLLEKVEKNGKKGPLLVQVNNALDTIIEAKFLTGDTGFAGRDGDTKIDGSGIAFDRTSENSFYILSDEGRRLFHYNWESNSSTPKLDLPYAHAEGVAFDADNNRFYIVTDGGKDENSKLYTYSDK